MSSSFCLLQWQSPYPVHVQAFEKTIYLVIWNQYMFTHSSILLYWYTFSKMRVPFTLNVRKWWDYIIIGPTRGAETSKLRPLWIIPPVEDRQTDTHTHTHMYTHMNNIQINIWQFMRRKTCYWIISRSSKNGLCLHHICLSPMCSGSQYRYGHCVFFSFCRIMLFIYE